MSDSKMTRQGFSGFGHVLWYAGKIILWHKFGVFYTEHNLSMPLDLLVTNMSSGSKEHFRAMNITVSLGGWTLT